ncbi:hypothetical protein JB92DRAFT_3132667 [Gautieria morchelliformis]|nr:hypothetical protein JB92DRAFT_3132667 [Gautieria morchelliformis]
MSISISLGYQLDQKISLPFSLDPRCRRAIDVDRLQGGKSSLDTEDSWGILAESSTPEQDDIWNKGAVDSWGTLEEASPTQNDVAPKKDKEVGLEEEAGATQKDDKSKKDKGTPHVPVTPPVRHVKADEEAFNTSVAADRTRQAANRKVQAQIDQSREQNAKGKGKPSTRSSKDGGRQHPPGKARYHTDTTLANKPLSHDDDPDVTSKTKTDDFYSPDPQDVAKQD